MNINASGLHFKDLNHKIRRAGEVIKIVHCLGQRYIANGLSGKKIEIDGIPGNALGAYLDGCDITVYGNAQDATGDTMNDGSITIHGSAGDATGYAMRGGKIFVKDNTGYRAGIHMKAYKDKVPTLVVGGMAGSFLGEYQTGGIIIVLGIGCPKNNPVGNFCGTGMHGGKIYMRGKKLPHDLPRSIEAAVASKPELDEIRPLITEYCTLFGGNAGELLRDKFYIITPDSKNRIVKLNEN